MSKYNGVVGNHGSFKAQIARKGKVFYLGNFSSEVQAAHAYDRAIRMTQAWSTRKISPNFADSSVPDDESKFTKFEHQMLTYLRTYFPEAERDARERRLVDMETPDVLLRDFQTIRERKEAFDDMLSTSLAEAETVISTMAAKLSEQKQINTFNLQKIAEMEVTIAKLRGIRHEDGKPKFKFTPVVPPSDEQRKINEAASAAKQAEEAEARQHAIKAEEARMAALNAPSATVPEVKGDEDRVTEEDDEPIYPVAVQPNVLDEIAEKTKFSKE